MAADEKTDQILSGMKDKIHEGELYIAGNTKDIVALQEWQVRQNGTLTVIQNSLQKIEKRINSIQLDDISSIRIEMAKGKPSWAMLAIITFLSSVAVGAVVFAIKIGVAP